MKVKRWLPLVPIRRVAEVGDVTTCQLSEVEADSLNVTYVRFLVLCGALEIIEKIAEEAGNPLESYSVPELRAMVAEMAHILKIHTPEVFKR